jgi:hypothetical protein
MSLNKNSVEKRVEAFSRNASLESLLTDLNENLGVAEDALLPGLAGEQPYPLILVMGPMRSGTTLFTQWLANTGLVAYPTNLLSRFYRAPVIGAKIQLLLTDPRYNFRNELGEFIQDLGYMSENGKTTGVLAPNEFWYFWRRFLADPERELWTDDELRTTMDVDTMLAELNGIMGVFGKPFAAKAMMFNFNIDFLNAVFDKVIFVHMKRELETNIASVLAARRRQYGNEDEWYSFLVPEYEALMKLDNRSQVRGQIESMHSAISGALGKIPAERQLVVQYEDFCDRPGFFYQELATRLGVEDRPYTGAESFTITRQ